MNRILIVDDDPSIRELVRIVLVADGFETFEASDGVEALTKLAVEKADMVIMDVMMPNMDGWKLCVELRKNNDIPLLMLTVKGEISQKVRGFKYGADDYMVKPFDPQELLVRVKALLRRYKINMSMTVNIGKLAMNRKTYEVKCGSEFITLPLKEFELLYKLAGYPGRTFTREQLLEDIWGHDFEGNERTLDVHINRLRDRFPENFYLFKITTIRGLGYRLEVSV